MEVKVEENFIVLKRVPRFLFKEKCLTKFSCLGVVKTCISIHLILNSLKNYVAAPDLKYVDAAADKFQKIH